jgi:hypothetical protein
MSLKPWTRLRLPPEDFKEVDRRITEKARGRLRYLNGKTCFSNFTIPPEEETLVKPVKEIRDKEALRKKPLGEENRLA